MFLINGQKHATNCDFRTRKTAYNERIKLKSELQFCLFICGFIKKTRSIPEWVTFELGYSTRVTFSTRCESCRSCGSLVLQNVMDFIELTTTNSDRIHDYVPFGDLLVA